jgi:pyridoxal phosphate enzyme (YggS family)
MQMRAGFSLEQNYLEVKRRIETAAKRTSRDPREIKLVAVSKTHPTTRIREAAKLGMRCFGENKIQEAEAKITELGRENFEWHLIGNLQANKARKAVRLFDVIQTLDSIDLAIRLERICAEENREKLSVFVQVDLAREATKSGIAEEDLPKLVENLQTCSRLRFHGLMILPPYFEDAEMARPFFKRLREIRDRLREANSFHDNYAELSMGMTHDFEIAIEEGATVIRIGTAIFGERIRAI